MSRRLLVFVTLATLASPAHAAAPTISIQSAVKEIAAFQVFDVSGFVAGAHPGEGVKVEIKECGSYAPFHQVAGDVTGNGGAWTTRINIGTTSQLRASWRDGVSEPISVQVHPYMTLTRQQPGRYLIWIRATDFFGGAWAVLERLAGGTWVKVKKVFLRRQPSIGAASTIGTVRAKLRKGTVIRAVLPKSQAGSCYLAGFTNSLRV